ncbi:MAG: hypothetical protein ACN4GW_01670 [Desulforhopalus sp.]
MKHSRNNFIEFNNPDVREEGKRALDRRKKRRKRIRNFSVITFICSVIVIVSIFLFPQYFSTFSFSNIFRSINSLFPKNTTSSVITNSQYSSESTSTSYPEYQFTDQQVEKAKIALLNKQIEGNTTIADVEKMIEKNRDGEYRYEIELISGRRIYSDTAKIDNENISFESKKGLILALGISEIKKIHLLRKSEQKNQ